VLPPLTDEHVARIVLDTIRHAAEDHPGPACEVRTLPGQSGIPGQKLPGGRQGSGRGPRSSALAHRAGGGASRSRGSRRAASKLPPASQSATAAASAAVSTGPMPIAIPWGRRSRSHGWTAR